VTGRRGVEPDGQVGGGKPIDGTHVVEEVVHLRPSVIKEIQRKLFNVMTG
jgi:hypothetical protein